MVVFFGKEEVWLWLWLGGLVWFGLEYGPTAHRPVDGHDWLDCFILSSFKSRNIGPSGRPTIASLLIVWNGEMSDYFRGIWRDERRRHVLGSEKERKREREEKFPCLPWEVKALKDDQKSFRVSQEGVKESGSLANANCTGKREMPASFPLNPVPATVVNVVQHSSHDSRPFRYLACS